MKKTFTSSLLCILVIFGINFNGLAQTKCLVSDYPLNGNATDVFASKNGTLSGTSSGPDRFGRNGYALKFNGTTDWVKLGTDADFQTRTISVWLNTDTFLTGGKYSQAFTTDNSNFKYGGTGLSLDNSGGVNRISIGVGTNVIRYNGGVKGKWYHCVILINSTHVKFYINGTIVDSTLNNSTSHSTDGDTYAHLGCNRNSNANFYKGLIDDIKIYNCSLSKSQIDSLYNYNPAKSCLFAEYKFDGNAKDNTGNGNDGTLNGTSTSTNRYGKSGYAIKLNGTTDWVKLGTDADLPTRTISLWFNTDTFPSGGAYSQPFSSDNSNYKYGGTGISLDNSSGVNRISIGVGTNVIRYTGGIKGKWYHCVISVSSTNVKFYLNGKIVDSTLNNSTSHSGDGDVYAHLGCNRNNNANFYKGLLDDVSIYNCTLTKGEIEALYNYSPCSAGVATQPKNQAILLNNTAVFSALSSDNAAYYKWQINTGSGFSDLTDGGQYTGSKTKTLSVASVKYSTNHGHKFRCITSNSSCADTSTTVTLTVICTNLIKTEPANVNAANGSEAKFNIASVFSNSTLQWQKNNGTAFQNLSNTGQYYGYDQDTLHVFNLTLSNNGNKFRCIANYGGCLDTSLTATLSVYCKPIIKNQPVNKTIYKGTTGKFKVSAYDFGTTFQWQLKTGSTFQNLSDAGQYSGTTTDSLTIGSVTLTNKKQEYRCILGYKSCSDTSKTVVLDVLCNPIVNTQPGNQTKYEGDKATFTVSSFDAKATFTWQSNIGTGFQNLNEAGQYSGVSTDNLNVASVLLANDNQKFRCILASEGCFDTSKTGTIRVGCKPIIGNQPVSKTAYVSDNIILNLTSLDSKATFMWQTDAGFGFQAISNAGQYKGVNNDTLNINNLTQANNNQKFRCLLTVGGCSDTSQTATLLVSCKPLIQSHPVNKWAYIAGSTFLHVTSPDPKATFKWQTDLGLGFQNISNAGQYKGVNNDTLIISNLTVANDNQAFRCLLSNGACFDTSATANITVKSVGINGVINTNGVTIFPNPSHDFVTITVASGLLNNSFKIIDQQGRIVISDRLTETTTKINIQNLANGVYILQTEPIQTRTIIIRE